MKDEKEKARRMVLCPNCRTIQKVKLDGDHDEVCPLCGCPLEPKGD